MFTAKMENSNGNVLTLTGQEAVYQVIGITGLNPPQAQINTSTIVGLDGAVFNSSKLNTRNIVLTVKINGDVEANRLQLYQYFRTKEKCKFYYSNDSLDVCIDGYVENVECDYFTNSEIAQISIICPSPYFRSLSEILVNFSNVLPQFEFPFSINIDAPVIISTLEDDEGLVVYNSSENEIGVNIEIDVLAAFNSIEIKNVTTGDDFELDYSFLENDKIFINTNKGQKSVLLLRDGVLTNLFSALKQGSVFFQLIYGMNNFEYLINGSSNADAIYMQFKYYNIYRGV